MGTTTEAGRAGWLSVAVDAAIDDDGRLAVHPPRRRTPLAGLRLGADEVWVVVGAAEVPLGWDRFSHLPYPAEPLPSRATWTLGSWSSGRAGPIGIALRVSGELIPATLPLRRRSAPWWRRIQAFGPATWEASLPISTSTNVFTDAAAQHDTLGALCRVLAELPEARARLADRTVVAELARQMNAGWVRLVASGGSVRRDHTDVEHALRECGYVHPYGRPLSASAVAPLDGVVRSVRAKLDANPYRAGRHLETPRLTQICRDLFHDVAPWPFAPLVDPRGPCDEGLVT